MKTQIKTVLKDGTTLISKYIEVETFSIGGSGIRMEWCWSHSIENVGADPVHLFRQGLLSETKKDELLSLK